MAVEMSHDASATAAAEPMAEAAPWASVGGIRDEWVSCLGLKRDRRDQAAGCRGADQQAEARRLSISRYCSVVRGRSSAVPQSRMTP